MDRCRHVSKRTAKRARGLTRREQIVVVATLLQRCGNIIQTNGCIKAFDVQLALLSRKRVHVRRVQDRGERQRRPSIIAMYRSGDLKPQLLQFSLERRVVELEIR